MLKFPLLKNRFFLFFCTLLIFLAWYQVYWSTLWPRYQGLKTSLAFARQQKEKVIQPEKEDRAWADHFQLTKEVEALRRHLWSGTDNISPYTFLEKMAGELVEITGVYPSDEEKEDYYWILPIRLTLKGHYSPLLAFIKSLEEAETIIELTGLSLHPLAEESHMLEAELFIKFYALPGSLTQKKALLPLGNEEIMLDPFSQASPSRRQVLEKDENIKQREMEFFGGNRIIVENPFLEPYTFPER